MKEKIDRFFGLAVVVLAVSCLMGGSLAAQAVSIIEDFNVDGVLDPNLEDADSAYTISGGVIEKTPPIVVDDRSYIRTVATDYNTVDFIAELTYTMSTTPGGRDTIHFFGLG